MPIAKKRLLRRKITLDSRIDGEGSQVERSNSHPDEHRDVAFPDNADPAVQ